MRITAKQIDAKSSIAIYIVNFRFHTHVKINVNNASATFLVSLVTLTLMNARESLSVIDRKRENWPRFCNANFQGKSSKCFNYQ